MWHLFLDESGDLGFNFDEKKSSRFLTISILATNSHETVKAIRKAVKNTLRRKVNRRKKRIAKELKGSGTNFNIKCYFYSQISQETFWVYAITLDKIKVYDELQRNIYTRSRLYNFTAKKVLDQIPFETASDAVELIVDKSKRKPEIIEFNEYVKSNLKARLDPKVHIAIHHRDSCADLCINAVDLFCWGIFRRYERNDTEWYDIYSDKISFEDKYL
jgi:hypothetical protein